MKKKDHIRQFKFKIIYFFIHEKNSVYVCLIIFNCYISILVYIHWKTIKLLPFSWKNILCYLLCQCKVKQKFCIFNLLVKFSLISTWKYIQQLLIKHQYKHYSFLLFCFPKCLCVVEILKLVWCSLIYEWNFCKILNMLILSLLFTKVVAFMYDDFYFHHFRGFLFP